MFVDLQGVQFFTRGRLYKKLIGGHFCTDRTICMSDIPPKPWSIDQMERHREYLCNFVRKEVIIYLNDPACRRIIIRAPVKSGKREIAEYIAIRDRIHGSQVRVHVFISAWHRAADHEQRIELSEHNLKIYSANSRKNVDDCICWIESQIAAGKEVIIHLDECDHGAGERQLMSRIWRAFRINNSVTNILYSATPEEVLYSGEVSCAEEDEDDDWMSMVSELFHEGVLIRYNPPEGYCGPLKFLEEGLVTEAKPFFQIVGDGAKLSEQGQEVVESLRNDMISDPRRNIIVLRLSYYMGKGARHTMKENKAIHKFLSSIRSFAELAGFHVIVDKEDGKVSTYGGRIIVEQIKWSSKSYWDIKASGTPILIVVDQTSSRSTEWKCHDRVHTYHDYRNLVTFSVLSQAQERINHYMQAYGGVFQRINMYGNMKTWRLSAGLISYSTYLKPHMWKKHKIDRRRIENHEVRYWIENSETGRIHNVYNQQYTEPQADEILEELGCKSEMAISGRVKGGIRSVPVYDSCFEACDRGSFAAVLPHLLVAANTRHAFDNPFNHVDAVEDADGRIKGYLRGRRVMDYDLDVCKMGWGVGPESPRLTICYKNGHLGVAIRWDTGVKREEDTLSSYKSMYCPRVVP